MPQVVIVTDASVDLPAAVAKAAGLVVAPLSYDAGGHHYLTGEQSIEEFYAIISSGATALVEGVSADDFEAAIHEGAAGGAEVICACQSVGSSFTRVSAEVAIRRAQADGVKVRLISPGRSTAGLGALCLSAARAAADGADADTVFKLLEDASGSTDTYMIAGSLAHLERTGELASLSSQSSVGRVDSGVPVFRVRGRISAAAATATTSEAEGAIVDRVERALGGRPGIAVVSHACAAESAERLAQAARGRLNISELHISDLGPTIGSVLGPGTYGIGFCPASG